MEDDSAISFLPENFEFVQDLGSRFIVRDSNDGTEKLVYRIDLNGVKREERRLEIIDYINEYKGVHLLPCMVELGESFDDEWVYYLVQETFQYGSLHNEYQTIRRTGAIIGENMLKSWMCQILLALQGLHRRKMIHGAVYAENVYLCANKDNVRLGPTDEFLHLYENPQSLYKHISSFKTARATDSRGGSERFVTAVSGLDGLEYIAPEMFNPTGEIAPTNDIWGLGTMMYKLATGKAPFSGNTPVAVVMSIERTTPDFNVFLQKGYTREFIDIISKMLEKDDNKRLTASDLLTSGYFPETNSFA
jgi:serine/threonine protein kinase